LRAVEAWSSALAVLEFGETLLVGGFPRVAQLQ
jgi:hypothetical protein